MKGKGEERGDLKKFDKMLKTVGLVDPTEKNFSAKKKKKNENHSMRNLLRAA